MREEALRSRHAVCVAGGGEEAHLHAVVVVVDVGSGRGGGCCGSRGEDAKGRGLGHRWSPGVGVAGAGEALFLDAG